MRIGAKYAVPYAFEGIERDYGERRVRQQVGRHLDALGIAGVEVDELAVAVEIVGNGYPELRCEVTLATEWAVAGVDDRGRLLSEPAPARGYLAAHELAARAGAFDTSGRPRSFALVFRQTLGEWSTPWEIVNA